MKIGIIGSGQIGGTLTRRLRDLGHDVTVANSRGPQSLTALAGETGARPGTAETAAEGTSLVIIAIPLIAVPSLPASALAGKIVVDANNYWPSRDGHVPEIAAGAVTSSRWTARHLAGTRVIKAFNTIGAQPLAQRGRPAGDRARIALPVAGDDTGAKRTVMALVDDLGFDPVDAGELDDSWRQQPGTPVFGIELDAASLRSRLASARL